ncbi:MAG: TIM barrel protein [Thermoleophilaceae bacterium]
MTVRLATGPVSWGVDFADSPANPPWGEVLDGIARAGFGWTELGPLGYLPEDPERLRAELDRRDLRVAGSFVFEPLHDGLRLAEVLEVARRTCRLIAGAGGHHLVVIDLVTPERVATAGRSRAARRLSWRRRLALVNGIEAVADVARREFGLVSVYHPHVGTWVEFEDEIEWLLHALDPQEIQLCIDTGHCAYAGVDPVDLYRRHSQRVSYLHLKDVDPQVRRRALDEALDFWQAIDAGVFCPLGEGMVDFEGLAEALAESDFDGPITVEQDRNPAMEADPVADLIRSREYLESVGISNTTKARIA